MARREPLDWLVGLYEEQGASLHRLAVLLDAEEQAGRIVRSALLALHRRGHRLIDPVERVEFLQEHVVHLARSVRSPLQHLYLPEVGEPRQREILETLTAMPPRMSELLIVSHYLTVFGPELAGIMRMSVRGCNQKLEVALETLRAQVGAPSPGSLPGVIESLSQELTAALRSSARLVQAPGTDTLEAELRELAQQRRSGIGPRLVAAATLAAIGMGIGVALVTKPTTATEGEATPVVASTGQAGEAEALPAQVRGVPLYYVGRADARLYREPSDLAATANLMDTAVEALLTLAPRDPDYRSAWGPGRLVHSEVAGERLTVDLSAKAYSTLKTPQEAQRARDQVVYTASELLGIPKLKVVFRMDGASPPKDFADAQGYSRRGLDPLPEVWIDSPKNDAHIDHGEVIKIRGRVKPRRGQPEVSITNLASRKVVTMSAQTSADITADGWREWSVTESLGPGTYEVRVSLAGEDKAGENKTLRIS